MSLLHHSSVGSYVIVDEPEFESLRFIKDFKSIAISRLWREICHLHGMLTWLHMHYPFLITRDILGTYKEAI